MKKILLAIFALFCCMATAKAGISLPSLISDNMVLQQNTKVRLWGWAPGVQTLEISPSWSKRTYIVQPDSSGKWSLYVKTPGHCTDQSIVFTSENGEERIEVKNILLGLPS